MNIESNVVVVITVTLYRGGEHDLVVLSIERPGAARGNVEFISNLIAKVCSIETLEKGDGLSKIFWTRICCCSSCHIVDCQEDAFTDKRRK
jgi:hypothetical protein